MTAGSPTARTVGSTSLRRRLSVLFVGIGVLTAFLVVGTLTSLVQLNRATHDRVDVYGPALLEVATLSGSYSDQETGLRGYLLGGDPSFLQPYRDGQATERKTLQRLRRLLAGRPDLVRKLDSVQAAGQDWRSNVAAPVIARVRASGASTQSLADVEAGRTRFNAIRAALTDLRQPVRETRDTANAALTTSRHRLELILVVALAGLVVLAAATFRALRRWVTQPLARLGSEVDRVEGGDLDHRVEMSEAPREIAVLAGQVDRMRARVVQQVAAAEAARAEATAARTLVEEQAEDLRRSNTELEQFAYVASHDLQEPLRKVASFCQLIERRYKGELDERGEQYIEFAVDGAKRMQRLISDLLMFSRVGRRTEGFQAADLEVVLRQALRQLDAAIEDAGATVSHDPLPTVEGDPSLLVQLLQNLVGNGIKFRGDEPPRVHLSARQLPGDTETWEFACSDNGIGVEAQYADKIFVIFQRLHSREAYSGTGIGLAMCKKIVEFHGGRMWLDTSDHDTPGAVFRWTLPARQGEGAPSEQLAPLGPSEVEEQETTTHDATVRG